MDAHKGGNISDMAVDGTKVPDNAGEPNVIPSVPNPHQQAESQEYSKGRIGAGDIQGAADNAPDMPRRTADGSAHGEVITGIGDQMPAQAAETKHMSKGEKGIKD
ncbi:hypothetical protein KC316_g12828 [Hortaea werneckii]|uniref:Uncharacterized protein n=1 Tax=Hortaea werneckii TaxID=91943 RepID=A0A3M6Y725_HORWE|nr:hypothetical protein KC324_g12786 [Hortaea werneckii]KAI7561879.1 hypothetical protein KC316_g12828 [Hortaea werneckii]RMX98837.1 hypothetical protein D0868_09868 [Hortaea werneckii]